MNFALLDADQKNVARWKPEDGNLRVIAAAGSGKTTSIVALTTKLVLVDNIDPSAIAIFTFANKAAEEIRNRLKASLNMNDNMPMLVATYHSAALRIMKGVDEQKWAVSKCCDMGHDTRDKNTPTTSMLFRSAVCFGTMPGTGESSLQIADDASAYIRHVSLQKAEGRYFHHAKIVREAPRLPEIWAMVERAKEVLGVWDFDDLLLAWLEHLKCKQGSFQIVIVDEAQDNNTVQGYLAQRCLVPGGRLVLVGDLRQTIHEWRGAYPKLFANANTELGAKDLQLRFNYRSMPTIVDLCNNYARGKGWSLGDDVVPVRTLPDPKQVAVIGKSSSTIYEGLRWIAERIAADRDEEEEYAASIGQGKPIYRTRAILCRTNGLVALAETACMEAQIPTFVDGRPAVFRTREADWVVSYLKAICYGSPSALANVFNQPKRYVSNTFKQQFLQDPIKVGQPLDQKLRILLRSASVSRGTAQELYKLADWIAKVRALSWTSMLDELRLLLIPSINDQGLAHESDSAAVVRAIIAFADRFPDADAFFTVIEADKEGDARTAKNNQVIISTIHRAKGREWDHVYVEVTDGLLPHSKALGSARIEEERLLYVALSRAKDELVLSYGISAGTLCSNGGQLSSLLRPIENQIRWLDQDESWLPITAPTTLPAIGLFEQEGEGDEPLV